MPKKKKAWWEMAKPRLHDSAARNLQTQRHAAGCKDSKKIQRQLKLSSRDYPAELDDLLTAKAAEGRCR